jgi:hypothetical protein
MKWKHLAIIALIIVATAGWTERGRDLIAAITVPHVFTAGTLAESAQVNENFSYLAGEIDQTNNNLASLTTYSTTETTEEVAGGGFSYTTLTSDACEIGDIITGCQCWSEVVRDVYITKYTVDHDNRTCDCGFYNKASIALDVYSQAICLDLP